MLILALSTPEVLTPAITHGIRRGLEERKTLSAREFIALLLR